MPRKAQVPAPEKLGLPEDLVSVEDYVLRDAVARYNSQVEVVYLLRVKWHEEGRPVTAKGGATGRADVVNPLLKEIQEAEMRADRLLQRILEKRKPGRPRGAASAPDRAQSPQAPPRLTKVA